ncbi:hypothetical protein RQCS_59890 (plasmid) [Rhodococcus qingshengii]|nr:hypothetical protein RQCS_59890 [Rhodococcus qingshengii]
MALGGELGELYVEIGPLLVQPRLPLNSAPVDNGTQRKWGSPFFEVLVGVVVERILWNLSTNASLVELPKLRLKSEQLR